MDESQPPRSMSVHDGRMTIDGLPHRYRQDVGRRFRLDAAALRFIGGYAHRDGRLEDAQRIEAEARVVSGTLHQAGLGGAARHLRLTLRPLAASAEATRLLLMLGYRGEEGEAEPFAEGFLAPTVFEALKADMLTGLAQELSLEATTNLWLREEDGERPAGQPVDWYLGLAADGRGSAPARGFIDSIAWQPVAARPAAEPGPAEPEPEPLAALHPAAIDEDHPIDDSADQLRRINWSLKQLLLVLAFLLIIIAVK